MAVLWPTSASDDIETIVVMQCNAIYRKVIDKALDAKRHCWNDHSTIHTSSNYHDRHQLVQPACFNVYNSVPRSYSGEVPR